MIEVQRGYAGIYLVTGPKNGPQQRHLLSMRNGDQALARYRARLAAIKKRPREARPRTVEEILRELKGEAS